MTSDAPGPIATAATFARLKTVLLLRTVARGGALGIVAFTVSAVLAIISAIALSLAAWMIEPVVGSIPDVALGVVTVVGLVSVLGPLMGGGIDDTIAPAKVALLPLRTTSFLAGSATAAVIGPWPLSGLVITAAATLRAANADPLGWTLAPIAVVVTFATYITLSRTVIVGLSTLMRHRFMSELAALLTAAIAFSGWALSRFGGAWFSDNLDTVGAIAGWTPFGFATAAIGDIAAGRWGFGILRFALAIGTVVVFLATWHAVTQRALTTSETAGRRKVAKRTREGDLRPPILVRPFPDRPWAAVSSRVLHELARNPRRRVALIMSCLPGAFLAAITLLSGSRRALDVFVVVVVGVFLASGAQNLFGFDGSALWADIVIGDRIRSVVFGFTAAIALVGAPIVVGTTVVLTAFAGTAEALASGIAVGLASLCGALGVFALFSALLPAAIPDEPTNAWRAKDAGKGCLTGMANLGATVLSIILALPPLVAGWVAWRTPMFAVVLLPLALAWGVGSWWLGVEMATRRVRGREPELLQAVTLGLE